MGFPLIFSTPNGKKTPRGEAGLLRDDAKRAMGGKADATAHGDAIQKTHLTTAWCGWGYLGMSWMTWNSLEPPTRYS